MSAITDLFPEYPESLEPMIASLERYVRDIKYLFINDWGGSNHDAGIIEAVALDAAIVGLGKAIGNPELDPVIQEHMKPGTGINDLDPLSPAPGFVWWQSVAPDHLTRASTIRGPRSLATTCRQAIRERWAVERQALIGK